jgi:hypothetical protein
VIAEPPSLDGANHDTTTEASPPTPETLVGAPGTVAAGTGAFGEPTKVDLTTHADFFAFVFDSNLS